MDTMNDIAADLADEWLARMSAIPWADFAQAIRRRSPAPCGESTSIETARGLFDVSDSEEWADETGGDIRLTIEVFAEGDDAPIATRRTIIHRPG